jgi:hypothetical protein
MDDTPCLDYFCYPAHTPQRQYEALRAVFVEHQPLAAVAARFGYRYGSLRNLVSDFRAPLSGRPARQSSFSPQDSAVRRSRAAEAPRPPVGRRCRPLPEDGLR